METHKINLLDMLAAKHDEWLRMVYSFDKNINDDIANEIAQSMYVRLNKYVATPEKIMFDDVEINTMYVYVTLRNLYTTYKTDSKTSQYFPNMGANDIDDLDEDFERELIQLQDDIMKEISTWHHYDEKLAKLILIDSIPMRKLSRDTDISLYSIANSVNKYKQKLKLKFGDKYNKILKEKN